ncbi:FAD-dependent oxidoreductase [Gemmata sp. G18]|uniref:FAD-dependent oxidoreductase n=1 Tax=Gemmata palustris TaxID=2822762 RepID=A0ABS5BM67_9BACT|nr:cyclic nucleotide-binding domain-containing thioredoxin-disulfide reductase [Gemmata palustris]MBP3954809.1 FAD-dependent oxidoreductase [Gemmata palustris]
MPKNDLKTVAFPKLSEAQLASLGECSLTKSERFRDGETLFECGQRDWKFFVVKRGTVEILDESGDQPQRIHLHQPGEFTGDVDQLTGRPAPISAVARGDTDVFEVCPEALRQLLNHHPDLGDIILQAFIARRQLLRDSGTFTGLRVIGSQYSQDTFRVRDFLAKNCVPFTWLDVEIDPLVGELMKRFGVSENDTPVVACGDMLLLRNPSNQQLAETLGLLRPLEKSVYDLVIVGGGPAGLAAAVYGASEGLRTLILERLAPGGQAGRSMRIENYLGFPTGITGAELTERAIIQANKFGANFAVGMVVHRLALESQYPVLHLRAGETISTRCLLIATGAEYRKLDVKGCDSFEGCGVYYAATPLEAQMCRGSDVVVVGGGNSAGQAAVFMASQVRHVYLVVRAESLHKEMSSYLASRIEGTSTITILLNTVITAMTGEGHLREVALLNRKTGETRSLSTPAVFSFIGAVPRTDWLPPEIERDEKGFVKTGPQLTPSPHWTPKRQPFLLETTHTGVFAAGDVRSGSVKRVASAVGEGSMAVQFVHEYMRTN